MPNERLFVVHKRSLGEVVVPDVTAQALTELFGLTGKRALVTGGTRGIGRMAAEALLRQGAEVVITSRDGIQAADTAAELAESGHAYGIQADLSTPGGVAALARSVADRFPALDILVNNAGTTWGAPFESYPAEAWPKLLHLNATAPFLLVQGLLPLLVRAASDTDPARVVNIGSIDGHSAGPFDNFAYGVAKAGLEHLTQLLARELGPRRITVNCLAPGPIRTKMTERLLDRSGETLIANNPLGRVGDLNDLIAPLLLFTGRGGAYLTGVVLPVDGGFAINRWCENPASSPQTTLAQVPEDAR
jgi:NAD(P)-dependent dehydrogenase (short-subunit alcohol dehydrogenase family)